MVALNDGSAFVVGGDCSPCYTWINSAETFNPQTGTWAIAAGKKTQKTHAQGAAALMKDGRVLVAGGDGTKFQPLPKRKSSIRPRALGRRRHRCPTAGTIMP